MRDSFSVSVVIPTRNRPILVEAALRSVLLQTHTVDEVLLVDDGSTPECAAKLEALAASHSRVRVLRASISGGPAAARNLGLEQATGTHLLFLDDDDLIHPRLCEDGLEVLCQSEGVDAISFGYECFFTPAALGATEPVAALFDYRQLAVHPLNVANGANPVSRFFLEERPVSAFLRFLIPIHSCLIRRATIGDRRFPETLQQGEDTYFWITLAAAGCRFRFDPRIYAFVRRHSENTTRSHSRYVQDIQACYEALLENRLLTDPRDAFLAHLKLLSFKARTGDHRWLAHFAHVAFAPGLLLQEGAFWLSNLRARRRLLAYYFGS